MEIKHRLGCLKDFIIENVEYSKKNGIVIGISGGVDSAACLYLAVSALGKEKCRAIYMPHSGASAKPEVELICASVAVKLKTYDLTRITDIFSRMTGAQNAVLKGNFGARLRSAFLYQGAAAEDMLVLNTSNRSEIMTGYFTKWGDEAGDISPFGNYYKSEVYEMASYLGVPEKILQKPPSPDFFNGQKDEDELNISYQELDKALALICGGNEEKVNEKIFLKVKGLIEKSSHKRHSPLRAKRFN